MDKHFRQDIEGLRAVAVLSVVIFHFGLGVLPGGFVGVDVFFVISGYLISGLLLNELERTGSIDLWRFYGRRARRLLPASLLVTAVTLLLALFLLAPSEQIFAAKGALASSLYASNFWFMTLLADYFAPESALNPFLHTWSLSVEEQFYLVWPTLLLMLWRWRPTVRLMAIAMSVLTVLSLAMCLWLSYRKQSWAFYASPARAWEFGVGALAVLKPVTDWARRSRAAVPLGWLGAAGLCATFLLLTEDARFPGWVAVVPALATVAVLISGASGQRGGPAELLKVPLMQWLGEHSYSIYLWHWPIVVYATILEVTDPVAKVVMCSVLTLTCAAAGFRLLERPVRASAWLAAKPVRSVSLGVTLTVAGSQQLHAANVPILVLRDSPSPGKNVGNCIARSRWRGTSETNCSTLRLNALDPKLSPLEGAVAASTGARFGDLSAEFCNTDVCPGVQSGILVYRDANHMTTAFAARQAPVLRALLEGRDIPRTLPLPTLDGLPGLQE